MKSNNVRVPPPPHPVQNELSYGNTWHYAIDFCCSITIMEGVLGINTDHATDLSTELLME